MRNLNRGANKTSLISQEITWLLNEKYKGKVVLEAKKDIERLKAGEPVDYLIGFKKFLDCKIDLSFKPLIPRAETEFWVKQAIEEVKKRKSKVRIKCLDMFAGSGCCGIAVLKQLKNSQCDFVDIDDNCLKQIKLNLKLNGIDKKRFKVIKSDVLEKIKGQYDLILANPPYISFKNKAKIQKSVLQYEPQTALLAKDNGLFFIKKFIQLVKNFLAKNGIIYLEFDSAQKKDLEKYLKKQGFRQFEFYRDQFNQWRYLRAS
ncbi:MAG: peptide chain release factor N(5)-glutamine methyltransferase [Candidatus Gribaldobacteria bacterium]|nr:peptide chain release factor N(5)-glutamine methyltransferase [Candidatus Gribaldobacteria bacterium]